MDSEEAAEYLRDEFKLAGTPDGNFRSPEEHRTYLAITGARRVKREILGRLRNRAILSLEELANCLDKAGLVEAGEDKRTVALNIVRAHENSPYGIPLTVGFWSLPRFLHIEEVTDGQGKVDYSICAKRVWVGRYA